MSRKNNMGPLLWPMVVSPSLSLIPVAIRGVTRMLKLGVCAYEGRGCKVTKGLA